MYGLIILGIVIAIALIATKLTLVILYHTQPQSFSRAVGLISITCSAVFITVVILIKLLPYLQKTIQ